MPPFDAVPVKNYILPILHILIGKVNNVIEHLTEELQAIAQTFMDDYYKLEKEVSKKTQEFQLEKDELACFNMVNKEYMTDLQQILKKQRGVSEEHHNIAWIELEDLNAEKEEQETAIEDTKESLSTAKQLSPTKKAMEEISKAFGQPLGAQIVKMLHQHGIDHAAQFGGALEGNGCRMLMAQANDIIPEIKSYVMEHCTLLFGSEGDVHVVCDNHRQLLLAFHGYISFMKTKCFHLTDEIYQKCRGIVTRSYRWNSIYK